MRAIGYRHSRPAADPESLIDCELPEPQPGPLDLLVRVSAVSVNPVDTKVRRRFEPPPGEVRVLGWDAVGTVVGLGDEVTAFAVGDRVWYAGDINRPGCNSELHVVDSRIASPAPASLPDGAAAALPLTALTAWELLFERLALPSTDAGQLLVVGAAGGVGSILVQLAKQLTDATVIATASRPETRDWLQGLGADVILDHSGDLAAEAVRAGVGSIPRIASLTHTGDHFAALAGILAPQGRIALIDDPPEPLDLRLLKPKSASLHWEFMFTRPQFGTSDMAEQGRILGEIARLVDAGVLRSTAREDHGPITAANLRAAHELVESEQAIGKVVLTGWPVG